MKVYPLALALALGACSRTPVTVPSSSTEPPPIQREMRGLWVATVANIDWPSRTTLTADQQRAELIDILDRAVAGGLNTIVFQVRPAADAVYSSTLEPWASLLTGSQGKDPGYDPLAFAITESHARGLQLHAWINPFRAGTSKDSATLAPSHLWNSRRDLVRVYGTQLWLDPGENDVQDHGARVIADIVRRYDIDGIHADDYFYPYRQKDAAGNEIDFPDSASFAKSGTTMSRDDWRRNNVDRFLERMYRDVHAIKPSVLVGLSPFGIWRPGNPPSVAGLDAFQSIYADSRKWLQQGWVDYLAPQLYWSIAAPQQSFPALLDWWLSQNSLNRHLWPGLASYRVNSGAANQFAMTEIPEQIALTRSHGANGHIHFNTTVTLKKFDAAIIASLAPQYAQRAVVPASPWLDRSAPASPGIAVSANTITMTPGAGDMPRWWVIRYRAGGVWTTRILFADKRSVTLDQNSSRVLVNALDAAGNSSDAAEWRAQ